jgi:hypothetical protein
MWLKKRSVPFFCLLTIATLCAACAHHRDVRPGTDGLHKVVVRAADKEEGSRDAIAQANDFCKGQQKIAAFEEENEKYTGDLDEKSYQTTKRISKVAKVVGGTTWVMGGKRESNIGGIVGLGGTAADAALGEGYTITMKFKCI